MRQCRAQLVFLVLLVWALFVPGPAHLPAGQGTARPATTPAPNTPADLIKADAEKIKAEAERRKVDVELKKAADARTQFFFDWSYRVGLALAAILLLAWLIPQVSEISLPWAGGTLSLKRAPKQPLSVEGVPPSPSAPVLTEVRETLKKTLIPSPTTDKIVDRLEETEIYQGAGVIKDTIYVCHHARKIARSENCRIRIYIDAESDDILDKVEKVTYRLHPTFRQNEITQTDRKLQFQLEIEAWGEFMLFALVYFKGQQRPIELKRYLNF